MEQELQNAFQCPICMEPATLPVQLTCCNKSRSRPACLKCLRSYLKLNSRQRNVDEIEEFKSINGCGCTVTTQYRGTSSILVASAAENKKSHEIYRHAKDLWMIRDLLGKSKCPNEGCGVEFDTTAELHRHMNGTHETNNCILSYCKCEVPGCNFFGIRKDVEGHHKKMVHDFTACHVCQQPVRNSNYKYHIAEHATHLEMSIIEGMMMNNSKNNDEFKKIVDESDDMKSSIKTLCDLVKPDTISSSTQTE